MAQLHIEDLSKRFGARRVLDGMSLEVASGELLVVLGASGCGKTTLLRLIAGFEHPDAGTIGIGGAAVVAPGLYVPPDRRRVGYLAQEGALFPHLSVGDNVGFGLRRGPERSRRIGELLESVGLGPADAVRLPHQLSGGEQQRVALARALAPAPQLILLDEPFAALDAALRQEVRRTVGAALKRAGATAILVTHDQSEALSLGDRVAVLREGRIVQVDDPVALYRRPVDEMLARFVGEALFIPGTVARGSARCGLGALRVVPGSIEGPSRLMIRPEQVRLLPAGSPGSALGWVTEVTFFGHDAVVRLTVPELKGAALSARLSSQQVPQPGETIGVAVEGEVVAYPQTGSDVAEAAEPVLDRAGDRGALPG